MFAEFLKESKVTARYITYLVFLIALTAMFFFQYQVDVNYDLKQAQKGILFEESRWGGTQNNLLVKPLPDARSYGTMDAEIPEQVMQNATYRLFRDISNNRFDTFLFGAIETHKRLDYEERQRVYDIFEKITGQTVYQVDAAFHEMDLAKVVEEKGLSVKQAKDFLKKDYYKKLAQEFNPNQSTTLLYNYENYMPIREDLSYEEYKELINEVKSIIGRETADYEELSRYGAIPLTYEHAAALHEAFVSADGISGAYARLFCDYMGIIAGIMPAFIAVEAAFGGLKRKKNTKIVRSVYEPKTNQIWVRFSSIATLSFIPVVFLALAATFELSVGVKPLGLTIDYFAFLKYSVVWLLPTVMFAVAVGLFFTIFSRRTIGIFVQSLVWIWSVMFWGQNGLASIKYGTNMFLRHNVVGEYQTYLASQNEIFMNRAAYTILALALITIAWYLQKNPIYFEEKPRSKSLL